MKKFLLNGRRRYLIFIFFSFLMITLGAQNCSSDTKPGDSTPALSAGKDITAFSFNAQDKAGLSSDVIGSISGTNISVTLPYGTSATTGLVATFTTTGASVKVGSTVQTSGITVNDFTGSITYTVTADDSSTQDYVVTVTIAPAPKEITAFSFTEAANTAVLSADVTGTISGTNITATVPLGANVTGLVATFTTTGASVKVGSVVQVSSTSTNDFTGSVTYTVTAEDLSTRDYTVTVWGTGKPVNYTAGSVSFNMVYVPGVSFPTGTDDSGTATVSDVYLIGETEVTYELWYTVYDWAVNGTGGATGEGQYTFANAGRQGGDNCSDNSRVCGTPVGTDQHPVTTINWRSTLAWMNALTEYYNAQNNTSLVSVYYTDVGYTAPIRTATDSTTITNTTPGSQDAPYLNPAADGFRLLSYDEWELAARYKESDNADGAIEYPAESGNWWTPGDYASGATGGNWTFTTTVAVYGASSTASVKSKDPNALGLYDMSGNVWEWCFDSYDSYPYRIYRGGGWANTISLYMQIGIGEFFSPDSEYGDLGFRLARTP